MNKHTRLSLFSALFAILTAGLFAACGSVSGNVSANTGMTTAGAVSSTSSSSNGSAKQATPSSTSLQSTKAGARSVPFFKVNSVSVVAGPEVTGHRCGTSFTETYTATFHIAAGGPGGTIVFQYTTNNGRSSSPNVSLHVAPKQTTAMYVFKWSGALPQSHTVPGIGAVMVSAPNQIISSSATPPGGCSNM